jgi:multiple sugar transport system ATP-binding protein
VKILIDQIGHSFGATVALDGVTIEAKSGEFLVLLGPSGCGKSTLVRIIAGLLKPSQGRVLLDDRDITALEPAQRDVAMVFQSYALYPHLTVARNLGFGLRARRSPKAYIESQVAAVAERLGLVELLDRRPRQLSGGQRQRVALGRAMVRDPAVFLMDEPLSNLDAQLRNATRLELSELHRSLGTTFVYVTHDQVEAMTMATRVAVMNAGRVEQVGTPVEVYDEPASVFVASFVGAPPMNLLPARAESRDGRVRLSATGLDGCMWRGALASRSVMVGVRPEDLRIERTAGNSNPANTDVHLSLRLAGRVIAVENLGSDEVGVCTVGDQRVAVRGPRPLGLVPGDELVMSAYDERIKLFNPDNGRRLLWNGGVTAEVSSPVTAAAAAGG